MTVSDQPSTVVDHADLTFILFAQYMHHNDIKGLHNYIWNADLFYTFLQQDRFLFFRSLRPGFTYRHSVDEH